MCEVKGEKKRVEMCTVGKLKDIIRWQEVPAEDVISQSQVTLEDRRHLGVEVFPARELLQHLHGQHKDLPQPLLLQ